MAMMYEYVNSGMYAPEPIVRAFLQCNTSYDLACTPWFSDFDFVFLNSPSYYLPTYFWALTDLQVATSSLLVNIYSDPINHYVSMNQFWVLHNDILH